MVTKLKNNKIIFLVIYAITIVLLSNSTYNYRKFIEQIGNVEYYDVDILSIQAEEDIENLVYNLQDLIMSIEDNNYTPSKKAIDEMYLQLKSNNDSEYSNSINEINQYYDQTELIFPESYLEDKQKWIEQVESDKKTDEELRQEAEVNIKNQIDYLRREINNTKNINYSFKDNSRNIELSNSDSYTRSNSETRGSYTYNGKNGTGGSDNLINALSDIVYRNNDITLDVSIPKDLVPDNSIYAHYSFDDMQKKEMLQYGSLLVVTIIFSIISMSVIYRKRNEISTWFIYEKVSTLYIEVKIILLLLLCGLINALTWNRSGVLIIIVGILLVILQVILLWGVRILKREEEYKSSSVTKRIKNSFQNTHLYKSVTIRLWIFIIATLLLLLAMGMACNSEFWWMPDSFRWIFTGWNAVEIGVTYTSMYVVAVVVYAFMLSKNISKLANGAKEISKGNYEVDIMAKSPYVMKELSESLNSINSGLKTAVDKAIKSERLKGELITNVSHDLKTPLTSIINYVDLLQKEGITDEDRTKYLDILDRKSHRLKSLIEDLFEASKAASGSMELNFETLDVIALLRQTLGEFEDKLQETSLNFVKKLPKEKIFITADGKRMWRVFENIISNAIKYSLPNSRVYVEAFDEGDVVRIEMKNISAFALDFDSEEIVERFKRGDSSRNTDGSGLGLSIANSIVNLHRGEFEVKTDGDLFKVIIKLNKVNK